MDHGAGGGSVDRRALRAHGDGGPPDTEGGRSGSWVWSGGTDHGADTGGDAAASRDARRARLARALASGSDVVPAVREHSRAGAGVGELLDDLHRTESLLAGVGPQLAPLLADPQVTDVLVNSREVWVDRGSGLHRVDVDLGGEQAVRTLAVHMAASCGRRLDDASPVVDGTLPGAVRLHAVLPPLSAAGTLVSLRTSRPVALTVDDLLARGTLAPGLDVLVRELVLRRANTLVSGATGSGKTTLLASLLGLVPHDQRIVCIEEVTELRPDHPHVVHLQERRANVQGAGAVTLADLVRTAMRMRPDRLVLGECRGAEVRDVLTALNTGHDGGWATIHANTVEDVPARLQALGALAGMSDAAVGAQGAAAFDAVLQMRRDGATRRISQVGVLVRGEGGGGTGSLECRMALEVSRGGEVRVADGWPLLDARLGGVGVDGTWTREGR